MTVDGDMFKIKGILLIFSALTICIIVEGNNRNAAGSISTWPIFEDTPCNGTNDIITSFEPGLNDGYKVVIKKELETDTEIRVKFDSDASISFTDKSSSRIVKLKNNVFKIIVSKASNNLEFYAKGPVIYLPPYIVSFKIDKEEYCDVPNLGYLENYPVGAEARPNVPDRFCGRRKIYHRELIVNGKTATPGAWPWHVAINRIQKGTLKYICGGTIISNHYILTAAHCAAIKGVAVLPESMGVSLGKHQLIGGDVMPQEVEVYEVTIHEEFNHKTLANDIALLKLKTAITYNEYVQPACIWVDTIREKLPPGVIFGSVTGWGFDQTESLSAQLQEAVLPMVDDLTCIRSKPIFFSTILDGRKFCAGYRNGTSACNGDSGGGFVVYVPYITQDENHPFADGAWYIKGLVSLSIAKEDSSLCDPNEYVVFTDIAAHVNWIRDHMD